MLIDEGEGLPARNGRRTWSQEDKCRIVAETLVPGTSVAEVARRHNMNAKMLFNWRREAREGRLPAVPPQSKAAEESAALELIPIGIVGRDAATCWCRRCCSKSTLPIGSLPTPWRLVPPKSANASTTRTSSPPRATCKAVC